MKKFRTVALVLLSMIFSAAPNLPAGEVPNSLRKSVDEAIAKVKPALVRLHVVSTHYDQGREMKYESAGSGAIISPEGHVITNHHVAGHAIQIICTLSNKEEIEAELVGTDPMSDISIVRLNPAGAREFPSAVFGDSEKVRVGDSVLAMGSPMVLSQSVTLGIVSNSEMVMPRFYWPFEKFTLDGEDVGSIVRWIGHDAEIYGGNSGGPLVNMQGEIIGINEIRIGLAGAIPANLAQSIAEKLIQQGEVTRAWLGLDVQPLLKHTHTKSGILIGGTISESPAAKAGFQAGDILTRLGGNEIQVRFAEEMPAFNQMVADLPVGKEADAVVWRDGKEEKLKIIPAKREAVRPKTYEFKPWGITARNVSLLVSKEMKRKSTDGVLITSVRAGGPGDEAKPSVDEMDILVQMNDVPVKNVKEFSALTEKITAGKTEPEPVVAQFERKKERFLTVVKVGVKEIEDPGLEVKKAWLPVAMQVLSPESARQLGIPNRTGMRITQIYSNTAAEKAGLKVGDIIVALEKEKVPASQPEDYEVLPTMIRQFKVGTTVQMTILREKKELEIPVVLARAPKLEREMKKFRDENFDFTARDISFLDKVSEDWKEDQRGAIVAEVKQGGWAALGHLGTDDLLLAVDGETISDVLALEKKMKRIQSAKSRSVVFKVLRGIHTVYLEILTDWTRNK